MSKHINVQITVQYVEIEPALSTSNRYSKVEKPATRTVREERINVTADTANKAFDKATAALQVLATGEQ